MGNQLSGVAPSQILSVESYFTDLPEFQFHSSLGSTRFLKVARAKHKEGYVVIKVFAIHDPSLPLKVYQDQISLIKRKLSGTTNVLPFQGAQLTEKAGLLFRQYVHDNLYDRISTRPFLNLIEKKWIVFQLLCALEQAHSVKVYHGDIKSENVLVTSWNWVLLTDIASFKPVCLPVDNPADFNYFFDTSRRRTCYIAPERFKGTGQKYTDSLSGSQSDGESKLGSSPSTPLLDLPITEQSEMTFAMDIFSAGCVIAELFCEGSPLFDLSQLLAYKNGDYSPEVKLSKIDNKIKELIKQMISKDPLERLSAKECMNTYRGHVFPEEFYTFLKSFFAKFVGSPVMTPDEKVMRIHKDLKQIKEALLPHPPEGDEERKDIPKTDNCFVMICSLITATIRSLKFTQSKLTALDLMLEMAQYVSDDVILERLLPYMFHLVTDDVPRVRAHTISTITSSLRLVKDVPRNEGNIFPEYILPNLNYLTNDPEVIVQVAFAENIACLAETALRFLEIVQLNMLNTANQEKDSQIQYQGSYDVELQALHELIQSKVTALLTNSENIVKRTLLEKGLTRLCVFFGRQKANDVLLSHIITFLNDKTDWKLRGAFYDTIVGVAAYIGFQSMNILTPLLQQGLKDNEEFVICKAIHALTCLTQLCLLQKPVLESFISEVLPFLCHPNDWIRYAAAGFISTCAKVMNVADVYCCLMPEIKSYLKMPIVELQNETILISLLKDPIPRPVYESLTKSQYARQIIKRFEQKPSKMDLTNDDVTSQTMRRLTSQGLNEEVEEKVVRLKNVILKMNASRTSLEKQIDLTAPGYIDLSTVTNGDKIMRVMELARNEEVKPVSSNQKKSNLKKTPSIDQQQSSAILAQAFKTDEKIEDETQVTEIESRNESSKKQKGVGNIPENLDLKAPKLQGTQDSSQVKTATKNPQQPLEKQQSPAQGQSQKPPQQQTMTDQPKFAKCKLDLHNLAVQKRAEYRRDVKANSLVSSLIENRGRQTSWRPKGQLVAHLHEHKSSINKIVVSGDCAFFATASNDATVKVWDTQRLDGKSATMRSKLTYSRLVGKINCLTFCQNSHTLACSSDNGSIHVLRIESNPSRLPLVVEKKLDVAEEGLAVDLNHFDTGSQSTICYATVYGYICGWDLRQPADKCAWKFKNDLHHGLITSFAVDPFQCWLGCGTSEGTIVCWDMRFQLPITTIQHSRKAQVRKVTSHPIEQSWIVASYQGNNEVSMWDLETGARQQTLWASPYPPLSQSQVSNDAILAIHAPDQENRTYFITGGLDRRIRLWDIRHPEKSSLVAGAATDNLDHVALNYTNRPIDGTEVIFETCERKHLNEESPRKGPDDTPVGHNDCITDISMTRVPQNFLISGSKDGVVKVWK
ncbi:phosphoinositide 3-kinase regulatory subunit 4-like [Rhopilema esculentum]|uniref:phosphoinositide 3-kinase regulatory subunit 4-like n=1 Tax=Rhopilema esculentum TaxID=499914 RepID=UPI0031CEB210|eukprot:gene6862-12461_t